jgi:hypothetical protein
MFQTLHVMTALTETELHIAEVRSCTGHRA